MGKIAFLFAGQGAQIPGMASEIHIPRVTSLFEMAEKLKPGITNMCFNGSKEDLSQTINTQPAMYLADLAYAMQAEITQIPDCVCGFSVGEIPALAYAGAFSYEDGFKIIMKRAEIMDKASKVNGGAMVAVIGLTKEAVEDIAKKVPNAWAANYNCPTQTVVAAAEKSVSLLIERVTAAKGRAIRLAVSGAFHCEFLTEAAKEFRIFLSSIDFFTPNLPIYSNLTGSPYEGNIPDKLAEQMCCPVQFNTIINKMAEFGVEKFVEVGPGKVLTGLVSKIIK